MTVVVMLGWHEVDQLPVKRTSCYRTLRAIVIRILNTKRLLQRIMLRLLDLRLLQLLHHHHHLLLLRAWVIWIRWHVDLLLLLLLDCLNFRANRDCSLRLRAWERWVGSLSLLLLWVGAVLLRRLMWLVWGHWLEVNEAGWSCLLLLRCFVI